MRGSDNLKEGEELVRRLRTMVADINGPQVSSRLTEDEMLRALETTIAQSRGSHTWLGRFERFAWNQLAPMWDLRLRRQIRLVKELRAATGGDSPATSDALQHLDDLVFARTYGRIVPGSIKKVVRSIASDGALATHELQNLVINRCFRVDSNGRVFVPTERWLFALGVLQFVFATVVVVPYLLLVLFSHADIGRQLLGLTVFSVPYLLACWMFNRYFISPYRLIPRAQKLIPRLQLAAL